MDKVYERLSSDYKNYEKTWKNIKIIKINWRKNV